MTINPRASAGYILLNTASASQKKYKNFFLILLAVSVLIVLSLPFVNFSSNESKRFLKIDLNKVEHLPEVVLKLESNVGSQRNLKCTHWDCFNIYRCGHTGHDRITVYVYPFVKYVDGNGAKVVEGLSREYYSLIKGIVNSKYYTANPHEACLFVSSLDTLSEERINLNLTFRALNQLPYWSNGENHLVFNMISQDYLSMLNLNLGNAMVAGAGFDTHTFREKFDISIPMFSPLADQALVANIDNIRTWKIVSSQINIDPYFLEELHSLNKPHEGEILILNNCNQKPYTSRCQVNSGKHFAYPDVLKRSSFCLVFRGQKMGQLVLLEAMAANCIPVIVMDGHVMPFHDVIDWKRVAIFIMESHLHTLSEVINLVSEKRIKEMRKSVMFVYNKYFSSIERIAISSLDIIQDRVYPYQRRTYDELNLRPSEMNFNPLFFPITAPRSMGFTAVILSYDRVQSLFILIERLAKVPSLMKIVVVWNNQKKEPPPNIFQVYQFPKITKSINVIKTKANKLSNRFYPYREIETEAVLHIDDDIVMLTSDEVEFAFEVWREFPDRIVGFPSRTHYWDNVTSSWKYESEWQNEISMVLTGAAFLHKYWSYLYTNTLPSNVKDWVDDNMNCEDIAMNFLVANVTDKPPIKVTPRKKFKCPECINNEMLSADMGHMVARSQCVDRFADIFGRMPLKSVEFRADPVLFKDVFPEKLKRFNNIGSL